MPTNLNLSVQFGDVIRMSDQLEFFSEVVKHMTKLSGTKKTASLLCKSIFLISAGSNDMFEYSASPRPGNDHAFLSGLVDTYKQTITVREARYALRLCSSDPLPRSRERGTWARSSLRTGNVPVQLV
jgi:hypothetical protein